MQQLSHTWIKIEYNLIFAKETIKDCVWYLKLMLIYVCHLLYSYFFLIYSFVEILCRP